MTPERPATLERPHPTHHDDADAAMELEPIAIRMPIDVRSAALTIVAFLGLTLVLQYAQAMIIPIVLGVLISYALEPIVVALGKIRVPRALAAGVLLLGLVAVGGKLLYELRHEADAIVSQLPDAARRLRQTLENDRDSTSSAIQQVQKAATELEKAADAAATKPPAPSGVQRVQVETPPINVSEYLMWGSLGIAGALAQLVLILFLAFFLSASGDLYRRKLVKIVGPSLSKKKITLQILEEISRQIERFLVVQVLMSILVGVVSWLAFRWVGLQQAGVWGLLAGIFNSIPYFGPVLVTACIAVVAFLQFGTVAPTVTAAGLALAITTIEGLLLTPWLTSRAARMNAVAVFIGLIFWGWVWNVWGMLLAVPMLMVIKAVCDHVEDFRGFGELLGE